MNAVTKIEAAAETKAMFYAVLPAHMELRAINPETPQDAFMLAGLKEIFANGDCGVVTLPNGDRVISGPRSLVTPDLSAEDKAAYNERAQTFGRFAVLKHAVADDKQAAFTADDVELSEIVGPAIVVGPAPTEEGADPFTQVQSTKAEVGALIGWDKSAVSATMVRMVKELFADRMKAKLEAASDDAEDKLLEFLRQRNASVNRDDISEEELDECGCDGCMEEKARRQGVDTEVARAMTEAKAATKN
ncbi:hypothetical protein [Sinorhizobium phage phiM5]|nr:hypothetical protein [Sinorhizobium phage phiM5]